MRRNFRKRQSKLIRNKSRQSIRQTRRIKGSNEASNVYLRTYTCILLYKRAYIFATLRVYIYFQRDAIKHYVCVIHYWCYGRVYTREFKPRISPSRHISRVKFLKDTPSSLPISSFSFLCLVLYYIRRSSL